MEMVNRKFHDCPLPRTTKGLGKLCGQSRMTYAYMAENCITQKKFFICNAVISAIHHDGAPGPPFTGGSLQDWGNLRYLYSADICTLSTDSLMSVSLRSVGTNGGQTHLAPRRHLRLGRQLNSV